MRNKFDYFDNDQKNKVHVEVCFVSVINFNHKKKIPVEETNASNCWA